MNVGRKVGLQTFAHYQRCEISNQLWIHSYFYPGVHFVLDRDIICCTVIDTKPGWEDEMWTRAE